jgi:hypothetical protein
MSKRRNWLWILVGVCILLVFIGIGAIIATTAWIQQNLTVMDTTEASALEQFDEVRTRYKNRPPLLDIQDGQPTFTGGTPPPARSDSAALQDLHVLVWDPDENKLASVSVPFWLLRLKSGPIEFSSYAAGLDDRGVRLSAEEIERYGPGILLDTVSQDGERILLWTQ